MRSNGNETINFINIGFSISTDDIYARASTYITSASLNGWANLSSTINSLKGTADLRWANPLELKSAVEKVFTEKFGEKSAGTAKAKATVCLSTA